MCTSTAVGIDLGTTFSCIAVFRKGSPQIIKVANERTVPSVVFFHDEKQYVSVGYDAEDDASRCYKNEIFDMKRIIGREFSDSYVQNLVKSGHYPFTIVKNDENLASVQVQYKGRQLVKSPEAVSSELLKLLRNTASDYLSEDVTEAVISVPAYFSNSQRKATKKAAELAGLKVLRFISEPVAAAVHYTFGDLKLATLLVFDFGGGTLDVSIIKVEGKTYEVKAVNGDTALGGRDIDEVLINHFRSKLYSNMDPKFYRRLRNNCIKLKKKLSVQRDPNEEVPQTFFYDDKDHTLTMSRNTFDDLNRNNFEKAIDVVKVCLYKADLTKSDLDEVVLVGGSCKNRKVQEMLQAYFPDKNLRKDVDPDEAIALGACIQAAVLKGGKGELEHYKISEVTPLSLGVDSYGDAMAVFIPRNTALPTSKTSNRITIKNDQSSVCFGIYEGERSQIQYNNKLGEFTITGIPKGKAGEVEFETTFKLDENGILQITAREKTTGKLESLTVSMGNFHLCEYQVNKSLKDAQKNKIEDELFSEFINERNRKISRCNSIAYDAKKISNVEDSNFLQTHCNEFITLATTIDYHSVDELRNEFSKVCRKISATVQKYPHLILTSDYEEILKTAC